MARLASWRQRTATRSALRALGALAVALEICVGTCLFAASAQNASPQAPRMTGRYHFLGPEDTLSVLQEEEMLKGYIDVFPPSGESDDLLSYQIVLGSRHGDHVEFRTQKIHEKYYRFTGTVERGSGKNPRNADYLELQGELVTFTLNSVTGEQKVEKQTVVLKWIPPGEGPPE